MTNRVKRALTAVIACALVLFVLPAFADSQARIVRLSYLDGSVQIDRNTGEGFEQAITNMPITQGVILQTGDDGEAEVEFENGSTIRLTPNSRLRFDQLSLREDGGKVNFVSLDDGLAYFDAKVKDEDDFRVAFAGRDIQLRKSVHFRADVNNSAVQLAVFGGELELQGTSSEVKIKKNETVSFNLDDPDQYALAKGIDEDQYDSWDKAREAYQDQYAYNRNDSRYASSPYYYGWSDLNYYGSFFDVPGYGYVWRPYSVGYSWDPFSTGYWVWYPSGYTWVSPYPWGWMPFRYGSWNFIPGYGWAWSPGYWNTGWYYTPRVMNPPSSFHAPRPPQTPPRRGDRIVIPVGNPSPNPGGRRFTDDFNRPGRRPLPGKNVPGSALAGNGKTTPADKGSVATPGTSSPTAPAGRVGREQPVRSRNSDQPTPRRAMDPNVGHGRQQQPRSVEPARPRRVETPRAEPAAPRSEPRMAPAPRVETPRPSEPPPMPRMSAPSFDRGGSRAPASTPHPPKR